MMAGTGFAVDYDLTSNSELVDMVLQVEFYIPIMTIQCDFCLMSSILVRRSLTSNIHNTLFIQAFKIFLNKFL